MEKIYIKQKLLSYEKGEQKLTGLKNKTERVLDYIGEYCPEIRREISEVIRSFSKEPEEIRLRSGGVSSVRISGMIL